MQKNTWKEWFIFTKRDRNAAFILLSIIILVVVLPYFFPSKSIEIHVDKNLQAELDQYQSQQTQPASFQIAAVDTSVQDTSNATLFFFDPNTLNEDGFSKLGLSKKIIHTIISYRNKGGYFKTPDDIRKIYGLSKTDADRLIPYIKIASINAKQKQETANLQPVATATTHSYKRIDINTATAADWKNFAGINDAIANRIIKFRTTIGGFKSVDQVAKTYGLNDSVFKTIKPFLYLKDSVNTNH